MKKQCGNRNDLCPGFNFTKHISGYYFSVPAKTSLKPVTANSRLIITMTIKLEQDQIEQG